METRHWRAALLGVALASCFLVGGCESTSTFMPARQWVKSSRISKPAELHTVISDAEGIVVKPDGTMTASSGTATQARIDAGEDIVNESEFTGPAVKTSSAEAASKIRADSPSQTADTIGKAGISALSQLTSGSAFSPFYWIGAACILAGAAIGYFGKNIRLGVAVVALGALFIGVGVTISQWPWIWLVVVCAALGLGAYLVYQNREFFRVRLTLGKVVGGIEEAPLDAQRQVKASIGKKANGSKPIVDKVVDATKARS